LIIEDDATQGIHHPLHLEEEEKVDSAQGPHRRIVFDFERDVRI
jgi:hypothetical protein